MAILHWNTAILFLKSVYYALKRGYFALRKHGFSLWNMLTYFIMKHSHFTWKTLLSSILLLSIQGLNYWPFSYLRLSWSPRKRPPSTSLLSNYGRLWMLKGCSLILLREVILAFNVGQTTSRHERKRRSFSSRWGRPRSWPICKCQAVLVTTSSKLSAKTASTSSTSTSPTLMCPTGVFITWPASPRSKIATRGCHGNAKVSITRHLWAIATSSRPKEVAATWPIWLPTTCLAFRGLRGRARSWTILCILRITMAVLITWGKTQSVRAIVDSRWHWSFCQN